MNLSYEQSLNYIKNISNLYRHKKLVFYVIPFSICILALSLTHTVGTFAQDHRVNILDNSLKTSLVSMLKKNGVKLDHEMNMFPLSPHIYANSDLSTITMHVETFLNNRFGEQNINRIHEHANGGGFKFHLLSDGDPAGMVVINDIEPGLVLIMAVGGQSMF